MIKFNSFSLANRIKTFIAISILLLFTNLSYGICVIPEISSLKIFVTQNMYGDEDVKLFVNDYAEDVASKVCTNIISQTLVLNTKSCEISENTFDLKCKTETKCYQNNNKLELDSISKNKSADAINNSYIYPNVNLGVVGVKIDTTSGEPLSYVYYTKAYDNLQDVISGDGDYKALMSYCSYTKCKFNKHVLAGGICSGADFPKGLGLQGSYIFRFHKLFSVGLQANLFAEKPRRNADKSLFVGINANFHVLPLWCRNTKLDLYIGSCVGSLYENKDFEFDLYPIFYIGTFYDYSEHWGAFINLGNVSSLGLRLIL